MNDPSLPDPALLNVSPSGKTTTNKPLKSQYIPDTLGIPPDPYNTARGSYSGRTGTSSSSSRRNNPTSLANLNPNAFANLNPNALANLNPTQQTAIMNAIQTLIPNELNIIINTSIPGFQIINYKPYYTFPKITTDNKVYFDPLVKLQKK